eukprot:CAMPEP_0202081702 /NCGR_PEP_ID=MMETSP0964-20121228/15575_1 /ASSEMBLY_ACC=CAM_ASM_000500 /TAXON_ID=4773 /ORGANISM="Schizochytrium aggregatum, Strain ATCC28209" /LENGTH=53 /DNA_ID=CAMNT_0048649277 /DNA_START=591 /DNA_END=752 /DNA_ORIENTATION=+
MADLAVKEAPRLPTQVALQGARPAFKNFATPLKLVDRFEIIFALLGNRCFAFS